ncbi:gluconate 2-dehydrogenase subunit 3 family protein [Dankookia sp. P2]|uniref:gluconate 2-dehydrogenase subunit 3 family protein n=1 Tax=Dankookia sp. P2 TaxID=3423955 RepID=UPI003D66CBEB
MSNTTTAPPPAWGDPHLTEAEARTLAALCARMIPASAAYGVPGADDPLVQADIARSLGRDAQAVHDTLALLDRIAGGGFAALPAARQDAACATLRAEASAGFAALGRLVLQCYYRDDRVMRSLGMEPRPPFPKGHGLPQGDWSLLDPVRARGRIWRDASGRIRG